MRDAWTQRYLALLGVEHEEPSLTALTRLTRAHLEAVPFENVTSILRRRRYPTGPVPALDPEALLTGWERRAGGGVCFEITGMVQQLLTSLGYQAHITLGAITWPFGHQAVIVSLGERRYMVDVGNGAPFFEPIPLDETVEIHHYGLGYRFRPGDSPGQHVQDRLIDGVWTPFCLYDLPPATAADRDAGYQRHHKIGETWVVGNLTVVRAAADGVHALRDQTLTHFTAAGKTVETLTEPTELVRAATEVFRLPRMPIVEAVTALAERKAG